MSDTMNPVTQRPSPQSLFTTSAFPDGGLLPTRADQVRANIKKRNSLEIQLEDEARAECESQGYVYACRPCSQTLHITLCFDGTNNHERSDNDASPPTTSNIARLYHASLFDTKAVDSTPGYHRYYLQGVGTEFKQIHEPGPSSLGLMGAQGGENRINWGITRLLDALKIFCGEAPLDDIAAYKIVEKMGSTMSEEFFTFNLQDSAARRKSALQPALDDLQLKLATHRERKSKPLLLGMQLYVYGFSRGAAEARAFASWLETLTKVEGEGETQYLFAGVPVSIVFLGLFDTVATVGVPYLVPVADGHMSWADSSMRLSDSETFLQHCVHLVAAHEQRGCFPVDSIRRKATPDDPNCPSTYRAGTFEYLYPGVHSDVGGGYPPGEQGKALEAGEHVLSQIALNHMYEAAFKAGCPLQAPLDSLNPSQAKTRPGTKPWLAMAHDTKDEFNVSAELTRHFNTWQKQLIPHQPLELAMDREAELITAWRIHAFVKGQRFGKDWFEKGLNKNKDMEEDVRDAFGRLHELQLKREQAEENDLPPPIEDAEEREEDEQIKLKYEQRIGAEKPLALNTSKAFEPMLDFRQVENGAKEFIRDYNGSWGLSSEGDGWYKGTIVNVLAGGLFYLLNEQDEAEEYARMRTKGTQRFDALYFPQGPCRQTPESISLTALFDNHLHDSRAWFMNATINEREVFSDYFRYRAVFFDDESSKTMSLVARAGQVVGVAVVVASIGLSIGRRDPRYLAGLLVPALGVPVLRGKVPMPTIGALDSITGIALPMLSGYEDLLAFTKDTGKVAALARLMPTPPPLSELNANTPELKEVLVANIAAREAEQKRKKQQAAADAFERLNGRFLNTLEASFESRNQPLTEAYA